MDLVSLWLRTAPMMRAYVFSMMFEPVGKSPSSIHKWAEIRPKIKVLLECIRGEEVNAPVRSSSVYVTLVEECSMLRTTAMVLISLYSSPHMLTTSSFWFRICLIRTGRVPWKHKQTSSYTFETQSLQFWTYFGFTLLFVSPCLCSEATTDWKDRELLTNFANSWKQSFGANIDFGFRQFLSFATYNCRSSWVICVDDEVMESIEVLYTLVWSIDARYLRKIEILWNFFFRLSFSRLQPTSL